jgi:hypothetical protein
VRVLLTREGRKMKEKSRDTVLRFNQAVRDEIPAQKLDVFFEVIQEINEVIEKKTLVVSS